MTPFLLLVSLDVVENICLQGSSCNGHFTHVLPEDIKIRSVFIKRALYGAEMWLSASAEENVVQFIRVVNCESER